MATATPEADQTPPSSANGPLTAATRNSSDYTAQPGPELTVVVPTLNETLGINYSVGAWRGIGGPKGLPENVQKILVEELKKAYDAKEFKDFMNARGFGMTFADQAGFAKFMADGDKAMGTAMAAAGLARKAS